MPAKQKILFVITQGEWGGAQRYVFDLVTALARQFEIMIAVGGPKTDYGLWQHISDSKKLTPENLKNVTAIELAHLVRPISLSEDRRAVAELEKLILEYKPDIVHLNSSKASIIGSWAVKRIPKTLRPKVVYTVHGWVFNEPISKLKTNFYRWLEKTTAKYKDAIIVLSEKDKKNGEALGVGKKLTLIPHGMDLVGLLSQSEARAEINKFLNESSGTIFDLNKFWFVTIANAYRTKGIDILLAAIAQKKKELSVAHFCIIGGGPELDRLKEVAKKLKLDNVHFLGFLPFASKLLSAFDALVLPSRKEGLPYVLLEALQARVPIIATRVGGIPELIENKKSGLLVNPDSVEELSAALCFAAENPEVMKKYAENVHTPPPLSEMISQTTSLYRQLLLRSHQSSPQPAVPGRQN